MQIRKLKNQEKPPTELLLLADPSLKLVNEYVQRGENFVAEVSGEIVGVYVLLPTRPNTIEIVNIAVSEHEQGKGIGKQLILDAINQSKKMGYKTIDIGTGNSSVGQLALYQKCGFRISGIDHDFFVRHYEDTIIENGIWCRDMIRLYQDLD
ncbi:ribosomal protein S18 acetylase RimI-like enzyme [Gracilibacillus halotolerans]|uniref:Ribosomal protein S18 acetylase RimI-like enzyme n=1 Tax=Gracilibacillus halotolerans TaxID=74386 RepID=A0A841RTD0_9BACI|nr:GNAT family N-acetyltransferase [Gracilibacillus halotolerans]MBB6513798.1 ribosomal protein S18 acetylase RimI-like enzyme [Gracilibacillus halotolerans]